MTRTATKDLDQQPVLGPVPSPSGRPGGFRPEGGFTLIELVIAMVILSVGILSVATLSTHSMWQVRRGQDLTNSALAAQQVVEDISNTPFDSVTVGRHEDTMVVGGTTYRTVWTVVDASDSLASGGSQIKVIQIGVDGGMTQTQAEQFEMAIYNGGS